MGTESQPTGIVLNPRKFIEENQTLERRMSWVLFDKTVPASYPLLI
jgi:hypothetical protein